MTKVSVGKYLGGDGTALAVKQASGVTLNPNTRSLFKSVALREFAFQFKFIAKSKKEADEVRKIIKFFRTELYPEALTEELELTQKLKLQLVISSLKNLLLHQCIIIHQFQILKYFLVS